MKYWRIGKPHPSIPPPLHSPAGFSLLEVLVSVSLLAGVVGLMLVAFNQTSRGLLYRTEEADAYKLIRSICDQIGIELEQAIVVNGAGLDGNSGNLTYYSAMDPPTTNTLSELRRIRYEQTPGTLINALTRSEELYGSSGLGNGWTTQTTIASNQIRSLSFQYAGASSASWADTWSPSTNLPAAVKISLTVIGAQTARRLEGLGSVNTRLLDEFQVVVTNIVHIRNAPVN